MESVSLFDEVVEKAPDEIYGWMSGFYRYAITGEGMRAMDSFSDALEGAAATDETTSLMVAEAFAILNEKERALEWLENAVWRGVMNYPFLAKHDPLLENVRGDVRFTRLMERLKHDWERFEV